VVLIITLCTLSFLYWSH